MFMPICILDCTMSHRNQKMAREHILKAAEDYKQEHYMGDVARVQQAVAVG